MLCTNDSFCSSRAASNYANLLVTRHCFQLKHTFTSNVNVSSRNQVFRSSTGPFNEYQSHTRFLFFVPVLCNPRRSPKQLQNPDYSPHLSLSSDSRVSRTFITRPFAPSRHPASYTPDLILHGHGYLTSLHPAHTPPIHQTRPQPQLTISSGGGHTTTPSPRSYRAIKTHPSAGRAGTTNTPTAPHPPPHSPSDHAAAAAAAADDDGRRRLRQAAAPAGCARPYRCYRSLLRRPRHPRTRLRPRPRRRSRGRGRGRGRGRWMLVSRVCRLRWRRSCFGGVAGLRCRRLGWWVRSRRSRWCRPRRVRGGKGCRGRGFLCWRGGLS